MKRFVLALAFTCALSATAMAGEIPSTGVAQPPPQTAQSTSPMVAVILAIISIVAR
jgi:hypothetical protein